MGNQMPCLKMAFRPEQQFTVSVKELENWEVQAFSTAHHLWGMGTTPIFLGKRVLPVAHPGEDEAALSSQFTCVNCLSRLLSAVLIEEGSLDKPHHHSQLT